jgi:photosystem II stability/assembly factor-like uncharacterized protein
MSDRDGEGIGGRIMAQLRVLAAAIVLAALGLTSVPASTRAGTAPTIAGSRLSVLYAGFYDGRLLRSLDGGASWQEADAGLPVKAARFVSGIAAAGSAVYAVDNGALFRLDDQGRHWLPLAIAKKSAATQIQAVAANPHDARQVYAVDGDGVVWRSADGGHAWTGVATNDNPQLQANFQTALALNPLHPTTVLMNGENALHRSGDGGRSWRDSSDAVFQNMPVPDGLTFYILSLAFDARNPAVAYLSSDVKDGLFRSRDGGASWQRVKAGSFLSNDFNDTLLAADPVQGGRLLAAESTASGHGGVIASADGGSTWSRLSAFPDPGSLDGLLIDPHNARHVLIAASTIKAGGVARATFYLSDDGGRHWQRSSSTVRGVKIAGSEYLTALAAGSLR